ncbi:Hypothetical protein ADU72_1101 [Pediococcus damnosus]|uniref:Uncharacterized protein n=1 Tax=Pediococcus damnosus TaxID=51663 RepID=A0A0R2HL23_9LACO|nr:hypothetical protein [Pediococcus damnosus]AMV63075.1 Hypothetical protein ADU70_1595 [Pediococcus damnosus]AMV64771.1 Hypothetical protein ADU71_0865 [Pediococcus damnosus]AMV67034.1 Hypothetical protein ADU72_1101 [Pediococcus damnosus]KJU74400.1 hypothetical protein AH70_06865 [Pediococcus damnosus LMG 28219]KRN53679.1 hypothetical protein IV84_GL001892 [Pediococcus damnosus]
MKDELETVFERTDWQVMPDNLTLLQNWILDVKKLQIGKMVWPVQGTFAAFRKKTHGVSVVITSQQLQLLKNDQLNLTFASKDIKKCTVFLEENMRQPTIAATTHPRFHTIIQIETDDTNYYFQVYGAQAGWYLVTHANTIWNVPTADPLNLKQFAATDDDEQLMIQINKFGYYNLVKGTKYEFSNQKIIVTRN